MALDPTNFPNAATSKYKETSPQTPKYNCIAWAVGDTKRPWWPASLFHHWPKDLPTESSIGAFVALFERHGYEQCKTANSEKGIEKMALYALNGAPTHAARQLKDGNWTSKIGQNIDIEHATLSCIEGPLYGQATMFFRRKIDGH